MKTNKKDGKERPRVVIVEDNRDAADSLCRLLEAWGYDARVAYSGPEGVRLAREWVPSVVLSDLGLPGLDGFGSRPSRMVVSSGGRAIRVLRSRGSNVPPEERCWYGLPR
jgi:CheY-like chemotaxis protein